MDFIHCNECFTLPRDKTATFFLTNCGHMFCKNCMGRELTHICKVCSKQCSITKLEPNLQASVRDYFLPPEAFMEKAIRSSKFQQGHRLNLMKNLYKKNSELKIRVQELERVLRKTKDRVKELENAFNTFKASRNNYESPFGSTPSPINLFASAFTARSNETNSTTTSGMTNNSNSSATRPGLFRKPNSAPFSRYRNKNSTTPASTVSYDSAYSSTSGSSKWQQSRYFSNSQQGEVPKRTPYSAFSSMNMLGSGNK